MNDVERVQELERRFGVAFVAKDRALAALTHRSYAGERNQRGDAIADNERLEFLGDAALDLAASQRLMEAAPELSEGELSKRRASLVNEATLAKAARAIDLGALLFLGKGEEQSGGRDKPSVLADALEAVVAAVYLDHGMTGVLQVFDRLLGEALVVAAGPRGVGLDPKSELQEWAQARKLGTLKYAVVGEEGPEHARVFEVQVGLGGDVLGRGKGASKKEAEQEAARAALVKVQTPET